MKLCRECNIEKEESEFFIARKNLNTGKIYYSPRCRKCTSNRNTYTAKIRYNNDESWRKYILDFISKNREKYLPRIKEYNKKWRSKNKQKLSLRTIMRKELIKTQTPSWANTEEIKQIYLNKPENMHVDHIVPLQGKNVCGFHVEYNLQYLTPEENTRKCNKYNDC